MSNNRTSFEMPSEHAPISCSILWFALGEALKMLGETRGNDGWKETLYERTHGILESMIENERAGEIDKIDGARDIEGAKRSASIAIDKAFDRIQFI